MKLAPKNLPRIVSGGQTGVDRGALDAALAAGVPCGGLCPRGRIAEDGVIGHAYPLTEMDGGYIERTRANVAASDGTVILCPGAPEGGTLNTLEFCLQHDKPHLVIDSDRSTPDEAAVAVREFVLHHGIGVLNIAGPRASKQPHMYEYARNTVARFIGESTA